MYNFKIKLNFKKVKLSDDADKDEKSGRSSILLVILVFNK